MILFRLAWKALKFRKFSTILTVISIALSFSLLVSVEKIKKSTQEGFTQTISQTDLIVGARSGPLQLILYSVFNMGQATNNISYSMFEKYTKHSAVEWTIPYTLGDGHRGYRVVGTNKDFFKHYHFRGEGSVEFEQGQAFDDLWDVVIGSEVAKNLNYKIGTEIVMSHGVTKGEGIIHHGDRPFKVSGIMKATGTALDRAVYISLQGFEALHVDWESGAVPSQAHSTSKDQIKAENLKISTITAFFLRTKSRIETLRLQREINADTDEPLLAIIPGAVLSELWNGLASVEKVLKVISWLVLLIGLTTMLIAITTLLNERRREMALLRSLGAHANQILSLMLIESGFLTVAGVALGWLLQILVIVLLKPWLARQFGLYLDDIGFEASDLYLSGFVVFAGLLMGLYPSFKAKNTALKDGLSQS